MMQILEKTVSLYLKPIRGIDKVILHYGSKMGWVMEFHKGQSMGYTNRYFVLKTRVFNYFSMELEKLKIPKEEYRPELTEEQMLEWVENLFFEDYEEFEAKME